MSKRGQVFILAAILLAVILFSLSVIRNKFEQKTITGDFEILAENFQIESSKLINSVMTNPDTMPDEVHEAFKGFSTMFTSYAKGKNPKYGLIYVLGYGGKIQVTNFLDRVITIQGNNPYYPDYGGASYSINISGGFKNIPADINFSDFNIKIGETPVELEFPCWSISKSDLVPDYVVPNTHFCAFMPVSGDIEFMVIIDGAPYYLCVQQGVPELMQVSLMRQGEQVKVEGTGKCIDQDFCQTFTTETSCQDTGGKGICCWYADRACINQYSYPDRCGAGATCYPTTDIFCSDDFTKAYFNSCGYAESEEAFVVEICSSGEVCRDQKSGASSTQCCIKKDKKKCSGNYVYWFSACSPNPEEMVENCQDGVCRDDTNGLPSGKEAECCIKEDHTECYENNIYWYNKCPDSAVFVREESPDVTCSYGWVCRDSKDDSSFLQARCCLENKEEKCFENKIYYYDGCGINQGIVTEDGDCGAQGKKCGCTDSSCTCKIPQEICTTPGAGDEDNNSECDYDSSFCKHGDSACPVGVTAISVSSTTPTVGSSITVNCTSTIAGVNSVSASVDGVGSCSWQSWNGNVAKFSCNVGSSFDSKTVRCYVDTAKSYKSGSDQTKTINVLASVCSDYNMPTPCGGDSKCVWCIECSGVKYTGGVDRCVSTGSCPSPYCWKDSCDATCDGTNGGCNSPYTCDSTTCSCVCTPATCSSLDKQCGSWSDGCDGTLNCGSCSGGQTCSNGVCSCTPNCVGKCGGASDGCVGNCTAPCPSGQVCYNQACCTPTTCLALGKNCGSWPDGCGGTLNCGTCPSGYTCQSDGSCKQQTMQFKCQKSKVIYRGIDGEYECNDQYEWDNYCKEVYGSEATGTYVNSDDDVCVVNCYYPEWTTCSTSPSCGDNPKWPVLPNEKTC